MVQEPNIIKDDISKILVKWGMPTRQVAISELLDLLNAQISKRQEIERVRLITGEN